MKIPTETPESYTKRFREVIEERPKGVNEALHSDHSELLDIALVILLTYLLLRFILQFREKLE